MPTYTLIDGGNVTRGEMRFTSYSNQGAIGEIGQIIRFPNYDKDDVRLYAIRKSVLDFVGGGIQDFPLIPTQDVKLWHGSSFIPLSYYQGSGSTLIYFPEKASIPNGTLWQIYRVFA